VAMDFLVVNHARCNLAASKLFMMANNKSDKETEKEIEDELKALLERKQSEKKALLKLLRHFEKDVGDTKTK
jgi:predicted subunit of tRNA(5-methylaminomethyl-2-thiouridylate) methyltransferase